MLPKKHTALTGAHCFTLSPCCAGYRRSGLSVRQVSQCIEPPRKVRDRRVVCNFVSHLLTSDLWVLDVNTEYSGHPASDAGSATTQTTALPYRRQGAARSGQRIIVFLSHPSNYAENFHSSYFVKCFDHFLAASFFSSPGSDQAISA